MLHMSANDGYVAVKLEAEDRWRWIQRKSCQKSAAVQILSNVILIITALCNNLEHLRLARWCGEVSWVGWRMGAPRLAWFWPLCRRSAEGCRN